MRIESGYLKQDRLCGQKNNRNAVGNFSDAMNKVRESISNKVSTRDSYVNGMDYNNFGIYTKNSISQDVELPIETERYKIEDATYVNGVAAYEIVDKQAGKDFYIREDQLAIQRDEKTGMEFLINMDQPFSYNVTMTSELKNLLNDLSDKRNIDIKEIPLQGGLVVNRDSKTGLNYLSIKGNEAQGVSVIITSDKDIETLNKLADEFQKYPVSSQRSTAGLYALLEISGNLKRKKDGFTFLTPNGITYIPYDSDSNKAWEIDMPGSCYATARKCLAAENDCANISTWTKILKGIKIYYGDNYGATQENNAYKVDDLGGYCMFAVFGRGGLEHYTQLMGVTAAACLGIAGVIAGCAATAACTHGNCHQSCQQHCCGTLKKVASLHLSFLLLDKLSVGIILPGNMTFFISTGAVSHLFPPLLYKIGRASCRERVSSPV